MRSVWSILGPDARTRAFYCADDAPTYHHLQEKPAEPEPKKAPEPKAPAPEAKGLPSLELKKPAKKQ